MTTKEYLEKEMLSGIVGSKQAGYTIEKARVKGGSKTTHGIAFGKNDSGDYVTWEFHKFDGYPSFYWGHYFIDENAALLDYEYRGE